MLIKVKSAYFYGIEAFGVDVEVNIVDRSMPGFEIVGLAGREVTESRERVKNAIINTFKEFPYAKKIVVNLAPADVPKEGSYYDLPIAASLISYLKGFPLPPGSAFFGEVSMDGSVRKTRGTFLFVNFAKANGINNVFIPKDSYIEVCEITGINIYPISNLGDLLRYDSVENYPPNPEECHNMTNIIPDKSMDFNDVVGQEISKRALEICAGGGHNILMTGSPGCGKSMLAKALGGILPDLSEQEMDEVSRIYSAYGHYDENIFIYKSRPFRNPHHTISYPGMVGGGNIPRPGEISLAHKGILFLDEFSEFSSSIIECLRQPIEDGYIVISRSRGSVKLPCEFTLVACSNPCPCGYNGDRRVACTCKPSDIYHYKKKLSGPILDRIDLQVKVWGNNSETGEGAGSYFMQRSKISGLIKERVEQVRSVQIKRFISDGITINARMTNEMVKKYCRLDSVGNDLLEQAVSRFNLTTRSVYKIIKVARTIADMEGNVDITPSNLAESVQYRTMS